MKQNTAPLIHPQRLKQLFMIVKLMMYLNQSTAQLYQANKNLLQKVQFVLLITVDPLINILKYKLSKDSSYIKLPKELDHPKKGLIN